MKAKIYHFSNHIYFIQWWYVYWT